MCGIAGIYRFDGHLFERGTIKRMGDVIAHRGPDDHRYLFWTPTQGHTLYRHSIQAPEQGAALGLAHRRLAIIDVQGGHQPMPNADETCWICYNGEIYNYLELRESLITKGYTFQTQCDTETILHLFEAEDTEALDRLNGIFAFAIWDSRRRELVLARDRFGVKPLYYAVYNNMLIFASEIKAILEVPGFPRRPDPLTIAEHFTFQNHFGDRTFFKDIKLLPPGHWLRCNAAGEIQSEAYWKMRSAEPDRRDETAIAEELSFHFERAVTRQLISEVPVGTYLSGGMDTGGISAVAVRHLPAMHTFTCGFEVPRNADDLEQYFDESRESFSLADLLGTQHHEVRLDSTHNFAVMQQVAWALDEPRLGISYQNWYTNRLVREHVTVVLGGSGGDELFAGYPWRHGAVQGDSEEWNLAYYQQWIRFFDDETKTALFSDWLNRETVHFSTYDSFLEVMKNVHTDDPINRALCFDFQTFLHGLLVVEDKLSMAHSVESRVPFLDNDFVDFVLRIPGHLKLKEGQSKHIFKQAMTRLLPEETLRRRKQGFTPPDATWYRTVLRAEVTDLILGKQAVSRNYFRPEALQQIVDDHMQGRRNYRFLLWSLMIFEWWNRLFLT